MAYNGLTNLGSAYLAKCMANKTGVTFTKIKVGNGSIPGGQTGQTTTDLYGFKKEVEILAKEQVDTALKLTLLLNNLDVAAGFYVKEMGIYIQDDDGKEKLYWYINKDNPSYLPDKNTPSNHRYNLYLEVTPVETTVVNFTGQDLLADKKYVDDSIKNFQTENNAVIGNLRNTINTKLAKGNLPVGITDAKGIYDLLENNGGINIDPNLLYLNDAGTKTQGKVYFDRNKKGLFECVQTTTATTNSTTYFVDISNKASADRLANLGKCKVIFSNTVNAGQTINFEDISKFRYLIFRNRSNGSDTILYRDEYINSMFMISAVAVDSDGYSFVSGTIKSYTSALIDFSSTNSIVISEHNKLTIVGIH